MAFDLGKLSKFAPLVGVYAFYNVFVTNYPADPFGGMKTALTNFMADPVKKLQAKISNITNLAIVIIGVPILLKLFKLPSIVKQLANLVVYYYIGDQVAAVLNGAGRFGAISYQHVQPASWGGEDSSFHQPDQGSGMISNKFME